MSPKSLVLAFAPVFLMVPSAFSQATAASQPSRSVVAKIAYEVGFGSGPGFSGSSSAAERSAQMMVRVNQPNIYVRDPLEAKPRWVAEGEHPSWSPDGLRLAYCARSGPGDYGQIHIVNANGKGDHRLTHVGTGCYPEWSPTGKEIAFTVSQGLSTRIAIIDEDGGNLRQIGEGGLAHWSPDGKRLLIERSLGHLKTGGSLWVVNADGTGEKEVLEDTSGALESEWAPTGDGVVFASRRDGAVASIFVAGLDGKNVHKFGFDREKHLLHPALSPDGKTLVVDTASLPGVAVPRNSIMEIDTVSRQATVLALGSQASVFWKQGASAGRGQ